MCDGRENLLYAISARGALSWSSFKKLFHTLRQRSVLERAGTNSVADPHKMLLRCVRVLGELGHCDFDFSDAGTVYAAPSVLFRLPVGGEPLAAFGGSRTPALVEALSVIGSRHSVDICFIPAPKDSFGIPQTITVQGRSPSTLASFAEELGIEFLQEPPAWQIAHFSGGIEGYMDSLHWLPASCPDWNSCGFDPERLQFAGFFDDRDELRMTRHKDRGRWHFALWKDEMRASASRDWGQFAVAASRQAHMLAYDARQCVFAVPSASPLPQPLARAVALCSGKPALSQLASPAGLDIAGDVRYFNFYQGVPPAIAHLVASQLEQEPVSLSLEFAGG